jgi:two-component system, sensor histidine kinase and response regulator
MSENGDNSSLSAPLSPAEKLNILLVDDQAGKLLAHEAILSELGETVITATSGRGALECLLRQDFAVILLDVNMPEMDGFETAQLIRSRPRFEKTPIIFITATTNSDLDRIRGYGVGAVDYLFLPIIPQVLKAKVRFFVELARQMQLNKSQAENLALQNRAQAEQLQLIQKLNQECLEANKELEAFCYTVSHDLRAPLRGIVGFSQILVQDCGSNLDEEGKRLLAIIQRETQRMGRLVDALLKFSRLGRQQLRSSPLDMTALAQSVFEELASRQVGRKPELELKPLPPARGDEALMRQVFVNLLSNAVKFTGPREVGRIEIAGQTGSQENTYYVKDNGVGFDARYANKLFGVFQRLHGHEEFEGTGVGLAVVQRIINRHGGRVWAESIVNEGATFYFTVPKEKQKL